MAARIDPSSLSKFGGLALVARSLVEGFLTGVHKSPYKGSSVEFAEHRQYYPGDEPRHLDWRVVAKTERYYVKEFEEETNVRAYLLVDASGSMAFRGKTRSKFEYAQTAAACLSYLMLHQLDAVGLVTLDAKIRKIIPPKASSKHLLRILQGLEQTQPGGETALAPLWHDLAAHHLTRRGLLIILSDCFDNLDDLMRAVRHFRHRRHDVVLFHVLAPEEVEFPFTRPTQFHSLELAAHRIQVDPGRLRREYLERFNTFCDQLASRVRACGADYVRLRTDEPIERVLGFYLNRRRRQK